MSNKNAQEKITKEELGEQLLNEAMQESIANVPALKENEKLANKPVLGLPKEGSKYMFDNGSICKVETIKEIETVSTDDVSFVVTKAPKGKNYAFGIPVPAFYGEYTGVEFVDGKETGKKFYYKPNKKTHSIVCEITDIDGKPCKAHKYMFRPTEEEIKQAETQAKERKAKRDAKKKAE